MSNNFNDSWLDDYEFSSDEESTCESDTIEYDCYILLNTSVAIINVLSLQETLTFYTTNSNFKQASDILLQYVQLGKITNHSLEELRNLHSIKQTFNKSWSDGSLKIEGSVVKFNGEVIPETLEHFILKAFNENVSFDKFIKPWSLFIQKLNKVQSMEVYNTLHNFLQHNDLTINENGNVIAYKVVTTDFKDIYTKTIDNSVGVTVTEDRKKISADSNKTCSYGLHACSIGYIKNSGYGGYDKVLVKVEIEPEDIVSVPIDYQGTKIRCCKYKVIESLGTWNDAKDLFE